MKQLRALLIINPISGTSDKKGLEDRVTARLEKSGINVDSCRTERAGHATELARQAATEGYDIVIAAGGDGTINETAAGLLDTGVTLGILPCGSGNGLARHLNIPIDERAATDIIAAGKSAVIDSGEVNGRPFFCTFGMGFDAEVSHRFANSGSRGFITYIKCTLSALMSYKAKNYQMTIDGKKLTDTAYTIAVCNASQYGNNAYIAPKALINDGWLDLTVFHQSHKLKIALVSIDLMAGSMDRNMLINTMRLREITFHRDSEGPAHIDGEPLMLGTDITVKCRPASLKVFTPAANRRIIPFVTPAKSMFRGLGYSLRNILHKH
ncbi:MAG: diacylglycerol kinase family lipid kinase [Paramuribaculum sp.]|nr:diacylglycerol kinase family lipid kinase [Paramuribaculum sp.]